jgi:hypothetical protein
MLHSIYSTAVGLRSLLLPLLKKEIAGGAGGWGVTEYLQLDWMDDGTDGWKVSRTDSREASVFDVLAIFSYCPYLLSVRAD